ncbi:MAG: hypothetical protein JNL40_10780 [Cyclobacteriaceae bacterium]|nr:hypothetical protein [Cyclobacteriaceae bacterium]
MRSWLFIGFLSACAAIVPAQAQDDDTTAVQKVWEVRGYVKDMQTVTYARNPDSLVTGNLLHNRVNVRFMPSSRFTAAAEFRTRLFWGEEVRLTPNFSTGLRNRNEAANMQYIWFQTESAVMHTTVDRLWMEYRAPKWEARLGRQRINWGISTVWNPNDIFNTYNFLDFDYEERPGRDAAKVIFHLSDFSNLEFAGAAAEASYKSVASVRYTTNHWNYDFQFTGGLYHEVFTAGTGWSGSIGDAGFKGEAQYFAAHQDTAAQVNVSVEWDYMFSKGWYANAGFLLNSAGLNSPIDTWGLYSFQLSPRNLMPTKYNAVVTVMKEFTPLLRATLTTIYSPGTNLVIVLPSLRYSLGTNMDVDVFWQAFYAEQQKTVQPVVYRGFIRFKWSF